MPSLTPPKEFPSAAARPRILVAGSLLFLLGACGHPVGERGERARPQPPTSAAEDNSPGVESDTHIVTCDVIVAGGSTAGLAAALAAAAEFTREGKGRRVCYLEPTDWIGGQLTTSGVPAVDFPHHASSGGASSQGHKVSLGRAGRHESLYPNWFGRWMKTLGKSDAQGYFSSSSPSLCTVSVRCFLPARLLGALTDRTPDTLQGTLSAFSAERGGNGSLALFTRTVPKRVTRDEKGRIVTLEAIRRTPVQGEAHRLSHVIADWYDPAGSARFAKQRLQFRASPLAHGRPPVVIDATEWGELLVLAKASYIQGVEASEDFPLGPRRTQCGQAIVFPLALEMHAAPVAEAPVWAQAHSEFAAYRARLQRLGHATRSLYSIPEPGKPWTWDFVWAYRRLKLGSLHRKETVPGAGQTPGAQVGDVSAQNWRLGNDYPYGYVFKSPLDAAREVQSDDWRGGIETETLREAELHALGWYAHLRSQGWVSWNGVTTHVGARIKLSDVFGTPHGLAKLPYLRESRRSVGIDDFVLRYQEHLLPGVQFEDAVGVGSYAADIHSTWNFDAQGKCAMPAYLNRDILPGPYTIPFRALTNRDVENLLVAGKTMAQTFFANSSTRVHPVEFASGTGSGVAAAYLARSGLSTRDLLANGEMSALRQLIGRYQPTVWPTGLLEGNRVSLAP